MDFEFKKTRKSSLGKLGLYAVLLLCITAAGIGSYAAMKKAQPTIPELYTTAGGADNAVTLGADKNEPQITVEWTTLPTTQATTAAGSDNLPFTGKFTLPMGMEILKDYSDGEMVSSKTMGDWRVHNGIDFTGSGGDDVLAIQDGTVIKVYNDDMWGLVAVVDHGNTMLAKYCGLSAGTTVEKGARVKAGEVIGQLGEIPIEAADGSHLHLEITVNDVVVDPLAAMNRAE